MRVRMDSWSSLHVVLMYVLVAIELLNGATGFSIPRQHLNQEKAVKAVQNHYHLNNNDWVGKAVFTRYLGKIETCTCEGLMYAAMLETYKEIFADMMKKSTEVHHELKDLKNNVTQLMERNYTEEEKVLKQLKEIRLTDVKNFTIQGGAVNDFRSVFDLASKGVDWTLALPVSPEEEKMRRRARKQKPGKQAGAKLKANRSSEKHSSRSAAQGKRHSGKHRSMKKRGEKYLLKLT